MKRMGTKERDHKNRIEKNKRKKKLPIPLHDLLLMFKASIHHLYNILSGLFAYFFPADITLFRHIFKNTVCIYEPSFRIIFFFSFTCIVNTKNKLKRKKSTLYYEKREN